MIEFFLPKWEYETCIVCGWRILSTWDSRDSSWDADNVRGNSSPLIMFKRELVFRINEPFREIGAPGSITSTVRVRFNLGFVTISSSLSSVVLRVVSLQLCAFSFFQPWCPTKLLLRTLANKRFKGGLAVGCSQVDFFSQLDFKIYCYCPTWKQWWFYPTLFYVMEISPRCKPLLGNRWRNESLNDW
jgi:hypothetical protein